MATPIVRIWRGTTRAVSWRLKDGDGDLFDLTGSSFRLSIAAAGVVLIAKNSESVDGLSIDVPGATVTWAPSLAESRLIPLGRVASYELERRIGSAQEIVAWGLIEGLGAAMPTPDLVEVLVPAAPQIVEVVVPGGQGPAGDTSVSTLTLPAGATVNGHRIIAWENGEARHADPAVLADGRRVIGVSLNAAVIGDPVSVRQAGLVSDASLALTPGLPVYLGAAGALTQTPPASPGAAYALRIGSALSPDTLLVRISQPISL